MTIHSPVVGLKLAAAAVARATAAIPAGFDEPGVGAVPDGEVAEGLASAAEPQVPGFSPHERSPADLLIAVASRALKERLPQRRYL